MPDNFFQTRQPHHIRKVFLESKMINERISFLKSHLENIRINFSYLDECIGIIKNHKVELDELGLYDSFNHFLMFEPQGLEIENSFESPSFGYFSDFGFYIFSNAKSTIESILAKIERQDYSWKNELLKLRELVLFYEYEPTKIVEEFIGDNGIDVIEYDGVHTDYRYYEEINNLIACVEVKMKSYTTKSLKYLYDFYSSILDILLQISGFYNDAHIFLQLEELQAKRNFGNSLSVPIYVTAGEPGSRIFFKNGLSYSLDMQEFYYEGGSYHIGGNQKYPQRYKLMECLCSKPFGDIVTYEELSNAIDKDINGVQTVLSNLTKEMARHFNRAIPDTKFYTNQRGVGYILERA